MFTVMLLVGGGTLAAWAGGKKAAPRPPRDATESALPPVQQDRLEEEVAKMPPGEVIMQPREEDYPALFALMRSLVGEKPETQLRKRIRSTELVDLAGGVLAVVEPGDGTVRLLGMAVTGAGTESEPTEFIPAFSATITRQGIEMTSADEYGLAHFASDVVQEVEQAPAGAGESNTGAMADAGTAGSTVGPCKSTVNGTCCLVVTDTKACVCCFSLSPNVVPVCQCTDLK
ncbi:MAG: hypothetical protein D6788_06275 [Planctomycetota bacterium]|nr:MAG: hypothetical protein D6788_06275 [Planctomycetota bacterium]